MLRLWYALLDMVGHIMIQDTSHFPYQLACVMMAQFPHLFSSQTELYLRNPHPPWEVRTIQEHVISLADFKAWTGCSRTFHSCDQLATWGNGGDQRFLRMPQFRCVFWYFRACITVSLCITVSATWDNITKLQGSFNLQPGCQRWGFSIWSSVTFCRYLTHASSEGSLESQSPNSKTSENQTVLYL